MLFLLIILALLIFLISIYISQHKQGGLVIGAMSLAYSSIVMILYFMPKVPFGKTLLEPSVVDYSWHPRIFFVLVMIGSSLFGCLAAIGMYVFTPVYAISPEEEYH